MTVSKEQADEAIKVLEEALKEVTK